MQTMNFSSARDQDTNASPLTRVRSASVSSATPLVSTTDSHDDFNDNRGPPKSLLSQLTRPRVPKSSLGTAILLVLCSCITSTTFGYDSSMMNGLNMLPTYIDHFHLDTATLSLATASLWFGGTLAGLTYGKIADAIGRRYALFWAAATTVVAVATQSAAQNISVFIIGRVLVGFGVSASTLTGPAYLAETLPCQWRAWGLGVLNDCYYIGGLLAAVTTYTTAGMESSWSWRTPSLVQGVFSFMCLLILPFIPESPRWLVYEGRKREALLVLAQTHADGDENDAIVLNQFNEILRTIDFERDVGETLSWKQMIKTTTARKRMSLAISAAVFSTVSGKPFKTSKNMADSFAGNVVVSYYLGTMLTGAGVVDTKTKLQIVGTYSADALGRKPLALISTTLLTVFIFCIGALTAFYGATKHSPGSWVIVACIFLFQGAYSFGWTPLLYLYPPEVLNYPIRANGMGVFTFCLNVVGLVSVFSFPIVLDAVGWKTYMINGSWNIIEIAFIWKYWVETSRRSLENIDNAFEDMISGSQSDRNLSTGTPPGNNIL